MKRLCIYLVYDKYQIIDRYIEYMLGELKTCVDYLAVVCNMTEILSGVDCLKRYADEIFYRENVGFDAGGFKDVLCSFLGWEKVLQYEELFLVTDSMFGPFRPMKDILAEMDNREKIDFWGLAKHSEFIRPDGKYISEHIQTYFLGIGFNMLHSSCFREYWERLPYYKDMGEVVWEHETKFTKYFENMGYTYDVLADLDANDTKLNINNNFSQYSMLSYELLKKRNFPFLKKQPLTYNTLLKQTQENLYQAIDYIDKETNYNVDLIWENIIRTLNMTDLQRNLHLQYIISLEEKKLPLERNIAIAIFVEYKLAAEYVLEYVNSLGHDIAFSIWIISEKDEILEVYRENIVNKKERVFIHNCDWEGLSQYDYVCILHDTDMSSDIIPSCTGKSYFYCIWENLFKDQNHIAGILKKFEKEKRLGFLAPPQSNFADYFGDLGGGWDKKYEVIENMVERLQLHCPISEDRPPFRVTDNFWIRGNILKCIKMLRADEYLYLPYLWSYFAQYMGYYSGIVESINYASMNEVNMQYYLSQITTQIKREYGDFNRFDELEEIILIGAINIFCGKYSHVYMYGAGYYAKKYKKFLSNVKACIISDGQEKKDCFEDIPIIYLSEIKDSEECGIVLCLNPKNQEQVIPLLEQYGIRDYFCIPEMK